jgi:hypothetical protein
MRNEWMTKRRFLGLVAGGLGPTAGCSEQRSPAQSPSATGETAPPTETDTDAATSETATRTTFPGSYGVRKVDPSTVDADAVADESLTGEQRVAFEQLRESHDRACRRIPRPGSNGTARTTRWSASRSIASPSVTRYVPPEGRNSRLRLPYCPAVRPCRPRTQSERAHAADGRAGDPHERTGPEHDDRLPDVVGHRNRDHRDRLV